MTCVEVVRQLMLLQPNQEDSMQKDGPQGCQSVAGRGIRRGIKYVLLVWKEL